MPVSRSFTDLVQCQEIFQKSDAEADGARCLGLLLSLDWLEPGGSGAESHPQRRAQLEHASQEIMRRQVALVLEALGGDRTTLGESMVMLLPRHAGRVHWTDGVEIVYTDLSFTAHVHLAAWFRAECGAGEVHLIADNMQASQVRKGIRHSQKAIDHPFSGFWVHEKDAVRWGGSDSFATWEHGVADDLQTQMNKLKSCDVFSFLVALSSLDCLPAALPALHHARDASPGPMPPDTAGHSVRPDGRQARWDRTLTAAVNRRRARGARTGEGSVEVLSVCDVVAQVLLSWRRHLRDQRSWHLPTIHACLEAVLILRQKESTPDHAWCEKACRAVQSSKENLCESLPPLLAIKTEKGGAGDVDREVQTAALAALCIVVRQAARWPAEKGLQIDMT